MFFVGFWKTNTPKFRYFSFFNSTSKQQQLTKQSPSHFLFSCEELLQQLSTNSWILQQETKFSSFCDSLEECCLGINNIDALSNKPKSIFTASLTVTIYFFLSKSTIFWHILTSNSKDAKPIGTIYKQKNWWIIDFIST